MGRYYVCQPFVLPRHGIVIPDRPALPPPGDAWRFVHGRAHTAETSVPRGNQRLLWARWSAALAQVGAINIGHVHLADKDSRNGATGAKSIESILGEHLHFSFAGSISYFCIPSYSQRKYTRSSDTELSHVSRSHAVTVASSQRHSTAKS